MIELAVLGLMVVALAGGVAVVGILVGLGVLIVKLVWFLLLPARLLLWIVAIPFLVILKLAFGLVAGVIVLPIVALGVFMLSGLAIAAIALPLLPLLLLGGLVWLLARKSPTVPVVS